MSLSSWYNSQYSTWNRTRRLQQAPYIARVDTNTSRTATAMAQNGNGAVAINGTTAVADVPGNNKKDSLFGPNIGAVSSGPAWTTANEKKILADELTPDIVRSWIEKSKERSQPTTTLQALVNLRRPTLRLSPLASISDDPTVPGQSDAHHHHHGLEFEYDCDAPKCGIYVHVLLSKDHPDAPATVSPSGLSKLLVFESVVEGGFSKILKLEEGAMLELGRFEHIPNANPGGVDLSAAGLSTPGENGDASTGDSPGTSSAAVEGSTSSPAARNRRRFTHFHFRKRSENRSVAGPALAVVDAEPAPADAKVRDEKEDGDSEGVKVIIRLAALDEQGAELSSPNEQITYLHVVRFGPKVSAVGEDSEPAEDMRPWVVKVVKREATIGPHTFHLHEVYGLSSSSSSHTPAPTAPLPLSPTSHTYPPSSPPEPAAILEDEPSSECLLCLSSPREVILLPCRHLVACKDCALNMVEFGAGGAITQVEEPVTGNGGDADAGPSTPAAPITTTTNPRRKRKAKGWFCPVCRQPYTSLLRVTTNPPSFSEDKDKEDSTPSGGLEGEGAASSSNDTNTATANTGTNEARGGGGLLSVGLAPAFLRNLSFSRNPAADIENQAGTTRVGA